jgi:cytochrome c oxidase subunit I+III
MSDSQWIWPAFSAILYCTSAALITVASRHLRGEDRRKPRPMPILIGVALLLVDGLSVVDLVAQWRTGLSLWLTYGVAIYAIISLHIFSS